MSKGIRVWLCRDNPPHGLSDYVAFPAGTKPELDGGLWVSETAENWMVWNQSDFHRFTRYQLKPGQKKRVRLIIEEC